MFIEVFAIILGDDRDAIIKAPKHTLNYNSE